MRSRAPHLKRHPITSSSSAAARLCTQREHLALQKKLSLNSRGGDAYEAEADHVAEEIMGQTETRPSPAVPVDKSPVQRRAKITSSNQRVPVVVQEAINSPGHRLDARTRAFMEARFGHDFAQVRVYADSAAADSARNLHALAYTLGPAIVFGAGQYEPESNAGRRLLAHELTHVVQQTNGGQARIQRQGDEEEVCQAPKMTDTFVLDNTAVWNPPELTTAEIRKRGQSPVLAKKYRVGDWVENEWEIVEIAYQHITVINFTCGTEETLIFERGEPAPDLSLSLNETNFGAGVVRIYNDFKRIVFEPSDSSKPPQEYRLETLRKKDFPPLTVYVLQGGERTFYPPPDLENMLRLHLVGERRGTPKPKAEIPQETWEDFTRSP